MGLVPTHTYPGGWPPAGRPHVVGNAPTFVDELRALEVVAVCLLPAAGRPQASVVPRPVPA